MIELYRTQGHPLLNFHPHVSTRTNRLVSVDQDTHDILSVVATQEGRSLREVLIDAVHVWYAARAENQR